MTGKEIRKEANKIVSASAFHDDCVVEDLVDRGIRKGMQMKKEDEKRLNKERYKIHKTDHVCKNCNRKLVRTNGRWKHEGFETTLYICGNPQSKKRFNSKKG